MSAGNSTDARLKGRKDAFHNAFPVSRKARAVAICSQDKIIVKMTRSKNSSSRRHSLLAHIAGSGATRIRPYVKQIACDAHRALGDLRSAATPDPYLRIEVTDDTIAVRFARLGADTGLSFPAGFALNAETVSLLVSAALTAAKAALAREAETRERYEQELHALQLSLLAAAYG